VELPPGTRRLSRPREIEAVASPLRIEVLEHLRHAGTASVADLARLSGRRPTVLHYHVNLLHRAGLLRLAGRRPSGKRSEALFALAAERFAVVGRSESPGSVRSAVRTLGATLRLAQREAAAAMLSGRGGGAGRRRALHARRLRAPLSSEARARVNRLLDELEAVFRDEVKRWARARSGPAAALPEEGEVLALTFVLAPAGRGAAASSGIPRRRKARREIP